MTTVQTEGQRQKMNKPETRGRPALKKGAGKSPVLQVVVSPELKAKAMRNGAQWVRDALTKAKEKNHGNV